MARLLLGLFIAVGVLVCMQSRIAVVEAVRKHPFRYSVLLGNHGLERTYHGQPGEPTPDTFCEDFTMGPNDPFLPSDPVFHAKHAVVSVHQVLLVRNPGTVDEASLDTPLDCVDPISRSQDRTNQGFGTVAPATVMNEPGKYGTFFNGTVYFVGRFGSSNPYHLYIEASVPVWIMMAAHGRIKGHRSHHDKVADTTSGQTSAPPHRDQFHTDKCCIAYNDAPPYNPALPAIDNLDKIIQPCPRCTLSPQNMIWASHVVLHSPSLARPMHVNPGNFPASNAEYTLTGPVRYALRQFRHYAFNRLQIPFPETNLPPSNPMESGEPNMVYIKRGSREMTNIAELEQQCAARNCGIKFITVESLGDGREQAKYFTSVDILMGVEGAGFIHAMHMPMHRVLIQLHPPRDTRMTVTAPGGNQMVVAKPYRFFAGLADALDHTLVNICLASYTVNVAQFLEVVEKYRQQWKGPRVVDVIQFS